MSDKKILVMPIQGNYPSVSYIALSFDNEVIERISRAMIVVLEIQKENSYIKEVSLSSDDFDIVYFNLIETKDDIFNNNEEYLLLDYLPIRENIDNIKTSIAINSNQFWFECFDPISEEIFESSSLKITDLSL